MWRTAVVAGTWTAVSNRVSRRQAGRWAAEDQSSQSGFCRRRQDAVNGRCNSRTLTSSSPFTATLRRRPCIRPHRPPADAINAQLAELQHLGDLKAQGILTEAEFEVLADACTLPFPENCFDASRMDRVLRHLAEPEGALAELVRVTRPDGRIVLQEPDFELLALDSPKTGR